MRKFRVTQTLTVDSGYEFLIHIEYEDGTSSTISPVHALHAAVDYAQYEYARDVIVAAVNIELEKNRQSRLSDTEIAQLITRFSTI